MGLCQIILNSLKTLRRCGRLYQEPDFIPLSNCDGCNRSTQIQSIASWNVQGLFLYMSQSKEYQLLYELSLMNQDIICLQEVFEDSLKQSIIQTKQRTHPYYLLGNVHKRYVFGEDSGLLVLSKYPIEFQKEVVLNDAVLPDSLSNKSILYFSVGNLNLVNTHLQSPNVNSAEHIATDQTKLILKESPFDRVIITGDLNNKQAFEDLQCEPNNDSTTWNQDILDYIVPIQYDTFTISVSVSEREIEGITDHKCIQGILEYK